MNIQDIIAVLIISIPFLKMMVFDQDELNEKKQISIYLFIGILSWVIGIIYFQISSTEDKWFVYFCSQLTLFFLILFNVVAIPYRKVFKRNPEISEIPDKFIDIIPTLIVTMGTVLMPLFLDAYLIKFVIK